MSIGVNTMNDSSWVNNVNVVNSVSANVSAVVSGDENLNTDSANEKEKAGETSALKIDSGSASNSDSASISMKNVNQMSESDRANLIDSLKAEQDANQQKLMDLVRDVIGKQSGNFAVANANSAVEGDSIWSFLAKGDYTVDPQTKADAQAAISEDGYYGVKQTSERLFKFAAGLAGDDVDKMKEMQSAMMEGYGEAAKLWGGDLPQISQDTIDAANKLFDDYYKSKGVAVE